MVEDRNIDMSREALLEENQRLKEYINTLESKISSNCAEKELGPCSVENADLMGPLWDRFQHGLSKDQISRYSRQIVLPSFGIQSQSLLCKGSVLVIGAGGLGSPALMYLAAAGVGRIGIVDQDVVELSNIHRQIIHTEESVGIHKADSAARAISSLNSSIRVDVFKEGFTRENALEIIRGFDVVLDATDNAPSRYLISDVCSICKIPLVSGASIGTDGQLTVYCYGEDGPCYRCLFPKAPAPQSCARCVDAGVLGVLPGIIGVMQALESIKILCKIGDPLSRRLLLVDGLSGKYHVVKLRAKSVNCISCGENAEITAETLQNYDYAKFTGQMPNDAAPGPLKLIEPSDRITVGQLKERYELSGFLVICIFCEEIPAC